MPRIVAAFHACLPVAANAAVAASAGVGAGPAFQAAPPDQEQAAPPQGLEEIGEERKGQDEQAPSFIYVNGAHVMSGEIHGAERCSFIFEASTFAATAGQRPPPVAGSPKLRFSAASGSAGVPFRADSAVDINNTCGLQGMPPAPSPAPPTEEPPAPLPPPIRPAVAATRTQPLPLSQLPTPALRGPRHPSRPRPVRALASASY